MGIPAAPTLRLYFTPLHFILQSPDTGVLAQLILERDTGRCYCSENFNPFENGAKEDELYYLEIFALLGILAFDSILYLGVITDADIIGNLHKANIYEIKGIELIPYIHDCYEPSSLIFEKENLSSLFTSGFYFSYYYDLTSSLQNCKSEGDLHTRANKSYYWNLELYRDLILQGVDTQWLIPIVQGCIKIEGTEHEDQSVVLALISRRSCDRTGTRYNCRGVDEEGNVANYVETEQIVSVNDHTFAYVQARGSVPVYWEQTGITAQLAITKSTEVSVVAFQKHVNSILNVYSHVTLVNLLNEFKSHEKILCNEFENVFKIARQDFNSKVVYQYYDFHANCKGKRYNAINELIKGLQDYTTYYRYYSETPSKILHKQKGIIRTNCLDCLDRTNVVQSYISWKAICMIFASLNLNLQQTLDQSTNLPLLKTFKNQWADNGDLLSFQYTGTGSTISSITRGEKQGLRALIAQSLKSIGRFYNANLNDAAKQKSIEAVLRRRKDSSQLNRIETEIFTREADFTKFTNYKIKCVTWNLGGNKLNRPEVFREIVSEKENFDLFVITFQEIVKLNPNNVLREKNNVKRVGKLKNLISEALDHEKFVLISEISLVGLVLFVFSSLKKCEFLSKIETDHLKLGFGGKMGNKGAVVVRFNIEDTSVCIIACHLASGISQSELRKSQIRDIQADVFVKEKPDRRLMQIFEHDLKFLCGDLNFRIDLQRNIIKDLIQDEEFEELLKFDQLGQAFTQGALPGYKEAVIRFKPTYKFDKESEQYDTSKKLRPPAWCDRILYNGEIEVEKYYSLDLRISDHRPVVAEASFRCRSFDNRKKQEITEILMREIGKNDDFF